MWVFKPIPTPEIRYSSPLPFYLGVGRVVWPIIWFMRNLTLMLREGQKKLAAVLLHSYLCINSTMMREHYCYSSMTLPCEGPWLPLGIELLLDFSLFVRWGGLLVSKFQRYIKNIVFCGKIYVVFLQVIYSPEPLAMFIDCIMMIHKESYILPIELKISVYLEESMISSIRSVKIFIITSCISPMNCLS